MLIILHATALCQPGLCGYRWIMKISIFDYTDDIFEQDHQYKHLIARRLRLEICARELLFLLEERTVAALKQPRPSQISNGKPLQSPFGEIGSIPHATFAIPPIRALRYFLEQSKIVLMKLLTSHCVIASVQQFERKWPNVLLKVLQLH